MDDGLAFSTGTFGFEVRTDEAFEVAEHTGRWVTVGVPGESVKVSLMAVVEAY